MFMWKKYWEIGDIASVTKKLSSVKSSELNFSSSDTVACMIKQVAIF